MAHQGVVLTAKAQCILHGHPRFAVILSMDCEAEDCEKRGRCHIDCDRERLLGDIPVVPGEVGTGPRGLVNTLPPAMVGRRGVIVYGHGPLRRGAGRLSHPPSPPCWTLRTPAREEYFRRAERGSAPLQQADEQRGG